MTRSTLSAREREVAQLICDGLTDKAIAERLGISINTVGRHLEHIMMKIGADPERRRRDAIKRWMRAA